MHQNHKSAAKNKTIYTIIALVPLVLFTSAVRAVTCTVNTPSVTINAGTFTVQRDAAVGSPISNLIVGTENTLISCNTNKQTIGGIALSSVTPISTTVPSYNGYGVFTTGLNGVGTILGTYGTTHYRFGPIQLNNYIMPDNSPAKIGGLGSPTQTLDFSVSAQNIIQLIKTSNIISSGAINIKIGQMQPNGTASFTAIPVYLTATINVLACSVSTPNVNVILPTVNSNSFTGVGSTMGDTSFTVGLQCNAGAKINATMNFTQDSDTTNQSVAAVTGKGGAGVASGVGIQLLYGNTALKNNTLTFLKTSTGGQELPAGAFTARYFQTKPTVQPGDANTTATMTLTYQ